MSSLLGKTSIIAIFGLLMAGTVGAISITAPGDWEGTQNENPDADDVETTTGYAGELTELYKANVVKDNPPSEVGSFAGNYTTTFSNTANDPSNALIEWDGGSSISASPLYLLAKDGNHSPYWYLWDITGWDGQEDISITGLWTSNGAISHVSIFGGDRTVPEAGATAILMVMSVGVLGVLRRKFT